MFEESVLPCIEEDVNNFDGYSLGFTLENALDFMNDVHSLDVSLFSSVFADAYSDFILAGGASGSIIGSISGLNVVISDLERGLVNANGRTSRKFIFSQPLPYDGEDTTGFKSTSICGGAPVFSFSDTGCFLEIDWSQCKRYAGLFYPKITIELANGVSTNRAGFVVGSVSFGDWGDLVLYANEFIIMVGSVKPAERYSEFLPSASVVKTNSVLSVTSSKTSHSAISDVSEIYLGRFKLGFSKTASGFQITTPSKKTRGQLLFLAIAADGKSQNQFRSGFEIIVA